MNISNLSNSRDWPVELCFDGYEYNTSEVQSSVVIDVSIQKYVLHMSSYRNLVCIQLFTLLYLISVWSSLRIWYLPYSWFSRFEYWRTHRSLHVWIFKRQDRPEEILLHMSNYFIGGKYHDGICLWILGMDTGQNYRRTNDSSCLSNTFYNL